MTVSVGCEFCAEIEVVHASEFIPPPSLTYPPRACCPSRMASNQPLDFALEDGSSPSREVGPSPGGTTTKTRLAGVAMIMFGAALVVGPTKIQESAHRRMTQLNSAVGLVLPGTWDRSLSDTVLLLTMTGGEYLFEVVPTFGGGRFVYVWLGGCM